MALVACPACMARIKLPKGWSHPTIVCPHCNQTVNTRDMPRETSRLFRTMVVYSAIWGGIFFTGFDQIVVPRKFNNDGAVIDLLVTLYTSSYLFAILLYRWFGSPMDAEGLWRERSRIVWLNVIGAVWLLAFGWQAMAQAKRPRPALLVGLALLWLAYRGVWRTTRSSLSTRAPSPVAETIADLIPLARYEAVSRKQEFVGTQHVLLAMARLKERPVGQVLDAAGITQERLLVALAARLDSYPVHALASDSEPPWTPTLRRATERAEVAARASGLERAQPEHLLIVLLLDRESIASEILNSLGMDLEQLKVMLTDAARLAGTTDRVEFS